MAAVRSRKVAGRFVKRLEDMTEPELRAIMHEACERLKFTFPKGTGFVLLAATIDGGIAQYASNCQRDDCIRWMKETIARWDAGDYVERVSFDTPRRNL